MKCEYSKNGQKCGKEGKRYHCAGRTFFVCLKHQREWKKFGYGSMLSPNKAARREEKEEYSL